MINSLEDLVKNLSEDQKVELLTIILKSLINRDSQENTQLDKRIETIEKQLASLEEKYEALIKLLAEISILKEQMRALESAIAKLITKQQIETTKTVTNQETPSQTLSETTNAKADKKEPEEIKQLKEPHPTQTTATTQQSKEVSNVLAHDLWKSIGFNERFAFIRELFGGNADEFTNLINTLNNISEIKEARQLLKSTHSQYHWDEADEDVVEMFYEIVETKFGSSLR